MRNVSLFSLQLHVVAATNLICCSLFVPNIFRLHIGWLSSFTVYTYIILVSLAAERTFRPKFTITHVFGDINHRKPSAPEISLAAPIRVLETTRRFRENYFSVCHGAKRG